MSLTFCYLKLYLLVNILTWCQSVQGHGCKPDWFGSNCQYKCHCKFTACDADGMCGDGVCERGWFGPGCQYDDLVYSYATDYIPFWLYDENDNTCNTDQTLETVTVNLTAELPFTWMRLHVQDSSLLQEFQVTFSNRNNRTKFACKHMRYSKVNDSTIDIHCDLYVVVQYVILTGRGVKSLCSLYVSGGRNVALRQSTTQSSLISKRLLADNAVDGNTDSELNHGSCSVTDDGDRNPNWNVTFTQEMTLNRYVLYNLRINKELLRGFTLTSFSKNLLPVMTHTDNNTDARDVYMLVTAVHTSPISVVAIQARKTNTANLVLCEVELYGDSVCPPSKYGRECQYTCNCAVKNEACIVSTGGCPSGCSPGFQGERCDTPCDLGKYGDGCNSTCSQFCVTSYNASCHHVNGVCLHGCQIGYKEPKCEDAIINVHTFPVAAVVGTVVGIAVLIVVTVYGVVLCRKCHRSHPEERNHSSENVYEIPSSVTPKPETSSRLYISFCTN